MFSTVLSYFGLRSHVSRVLNSPGSVGVNVASVKCLYLRAELSGIFVKAHGRFSGKSRGKQCDFKSLSALLTVPITGEIQNV